MKQYYYFHRFLSAKIANRNKSAICRRKRVKYYFTDTEYNIINKRHAQYVMKS